MSEIKIELQTSIEKLSPRASKLFGCPDISVNNENFEIPSFECWGMERDMTFIAQINCSELAEFDRENILPHEGMLYFFYNAAEMTATPNEPDGAGVIYDPECNGETRVFELYDENGEDISMPEKKIIFSLSDDSESPENAILPSPVYDDEADELFSELDDVSGESETENEDEDDVILLQLKLFEHNDEELKADTQGEQLCFLIDKKRLNEKDFSDVRVMLI